MSEFIGELGVVGLKQKPARERYKSHMDGGNKVRHGTRAGNVLALAAIAKIKGVRRKLKKAQKPTAFVVRSLKHPDEVDAFRAAYGPGFFLLGVYQPKASRVRYLVDREGMNESDAESLVERDEAEPEDFGQRTRDVFERSDAFIDWSRPDAKDQVGRVLDLLFGRPELTPTRDEQAMFQAYASSLRSGDLSRQVGAVVQNAHGDFVAVGANDVPCFGGGLYWPGADDQRDYVRGFDSNERRRNRMLEEVAKAFEFKGEGISLEAAREKLAETGLLDITEYGRAVHAEMEALLSCARSGVSPREGTLYTTTFPCHNCAKHVVAAGIKRVVYVEPYPKSRALELHDDAIEVDRTEWQGPQSKVWFEPFVGIGPRRFVDLFSMRFGSGRKLKRKDGSGAAIGWNRANAKVRIPMLPTSYLERETVATSRLLELKGSLLCPEETKAAKNSALSGRKPKKRPTK